MESEEWYECDECEERYKPQKFLRGRPNEKKHPPLGWLQDNVPLRCQECCLDDGQAPTDTGNIPAMMFESKRPKPLPQLLEDAFDDVPERYERWARELYPEHYD
jgi:hypothetical protein